ncbi:MAG: toxin-antitoxin system HicB family antitoxin [Chloroflexi bacterium]|nr:MAG: toxin-antitoxin system HicB family antitoxin [Chloroflexota bacterium]
MDARTVEEYLALPYTIEVIRDRSSGDDGYVARVVELPGCLTQADTFAELGEMIEDAMRVWIESALEDGQPVPVPRSADAFSGKFVVRVPRSLHRQLVAAAARDGVSLNTYVNVALAQMVGMAGQDSELVATAELDLALV